MTPPERSTRKPFFGYTSGFCTANYSPSGRRPFTPLQYAHGSWFWILRVLLTFQPGTSRALLLVGFIPSVVLMGMVGSVSCIFSSRLTEYELRFAYGTDIRKRGGVHKSMGHKVPWIIS